MVGRNGGLYWEDWTDNIFEAYLEIVVHSLCCVIIVLLIVFCVYIMYCHKNATQSQRVSVDARFHKYLLISLVVTFVYVYLTSFMNIVSVTVFGWRPKLGCFYRNISVIPLTLQRTVTYYFYILRLHVTFKGSIAEISNKCIYIFNISVSISSIVVTMLYLVMIYIETTNSDVFICPDTSFRWIVGSVYVFSDTIWNVILTVIYIKK